MRFAAARFFCTPATSGYPRPDGDFASGLPDPVIGPYNHLILANIADCQVDKYD